MTDGASEPVEQAVAPAATPTGEPERKSLWDRLKPLWWMRGFVGALTLVALLDAAGWIREDWLRVFHAVATRWHEFLGWIAERITIALPAGWIVTAEEALFLSAASIFILPLGIANAVSSSSEGRWFEWARLGAIIAMLLLLILVVNVSNDSPLGLPPVITEAFNLACAAICIWAMWNHARSYLKALVFTLTALLTLEAVYLAPTAQAWLQPFVDWIDPSGAALAN